MSLQANRQASRIVRWQGMFSVLLALILFLVSGVHVALAVFSGAMACWLPTVLFVRLLFPAGRPPRGSLAFFLVTETCRLLVTALLLLLAFCLFPGRLFAVLGGFSVTLVAFQAASLLMMAGWHPPQVSFRKRRP